MTVQSVERAFDILSLFTVEHPSLGLSDISRLTGVLKPTTQGLINTLTKRGYLEQHPETKKYHLGILSFELGAMFTSTSEIYQKSFRKVHELESKTGLIVRIGVWDNAGVTIIMERMPSFTEEVPPVRLGPRNKAYCTAIGRAILAFSSSQFINTYLNDAELISLTPFTKTSKKELLVELEETRKRGYSFIDREISVQNTSMACPIYNEYGEVRAGIGITGNHERISVNERADLVKILKIVAEDISISIGHSFKNLAAL